MKIFDYQTGRELTDVSVVLSEEELKDLALYVQKLGRDPHVARAHLTEFSGPGVLSELTLAVEHRAN